MRKCNGVFEGGGVRGIGHVGAACALEQNGYQFVDLAGSSAGAVVAALLAAGYTCRELKQEMETLNYMRFRGKDWMDRLGVPGRACSILLTLGIYDTDYVEQWMEELLSRKHMQRFGDVEQTGRKLKITASDLTAQRLLILPDDLEDFGIDPQEFSIAAAVRMSISIPVYFEPVRQKDRQGCEHLIVDGGLLSNYPVWILDDGKSFPVRPTFGFKFTGDPKNSCSSAGGVNIVEYLKAVVGTCLDAVDQSHLSEGDYERTIRISSMVGKGTEARRIRAVDFDITQEESQLLFENGRRAAEFFLRTWDFESWKRRYRKQTDRYYKM